MNRPPEDRVSLCPQKLSAALGLVIVPDAATIQRAYALAKDTMPRDAQFTLSEGSLPHLTLYHGKLEGLPKNFVQTTLGTLRGELVGKQFTLKSIVAFGGNFIFWNVDSSSTGFETLQQSHLTALGIADYLDRSSVAKAVSEEALSLTEEEQENVKLFGHPLVRSLYTPHITLGLHPGISEQLAPGLEHSWLFEVASVELVRVGHPGRVEEIIDLLPS